MGGDGCRVRSGGRLISVCSVLSPLAPHRPIAHPHPPQALLPRNGAAHPAGVNRAARGAVQAVHRARAVAVDRLLHPRVCAGLHLWWVGGWRRFTRCLRLGWCTGSVRALSQLQFQLQRSFRHGFCLVLPCTCSRGGEERRHAAGLRVAVHRLRQLLLAGGGAAHHQGRQLCKVSARWVEG